MIQKNFKKFNLAALAMAAAIAYAPASNAAVASYVQDHEGLDAGNSFELGFVGGEQYGIFADVWFGDVGTGVFLYSYGVFSAPNGGAGFSAIAGGEGGAAQGEQYLNIYSDYDNVDHGNGFNINTAVFQEQTIDAADIGSTVTFQFDVKSPFAGGIADATNATASAFIKTLDPLNGFATTNDIRFDSTFVSNTDWTTQTLSLDLTDAALAGQILQFGFGTVASDYSDSGVYYDNICFNTTGGNCFPPPAVPIPAAVWLFGSGLLGLVGVARRKRMS